MKEYLDKSDVLDAIKAYKNSFCDRNGYLENVETNELVYDTLCDLEDSIEALEVFNYQTIRNIMTKAEAKVYIDPMIDTNKGKFYVLRNVQDFDRVTLLAQAIWVEDEDLVYTFPGNTTDEEIIKEINNSPIPSRY